MKQIRTNTCVDGLARNLFVDFWAFKFLYDVVNSRSTEDKQRERILRHKREEVFKISQLSDDWSMQRAWKMIVKVFIAIALVILVKGTHNADVMSSIFSQLGNYSE